MNRLTLESWILLLYFEWKMRPSEFRELHQIVRQEPVFPTDTATRISTADLCRAMDYACVFYLKRVLCLQRSAATTILLRRHGWNAELVLGAQLAPFRSHAWCEIEGSIVNDKPYASEIYAILERC
jgi:hypothetical protein